MLGCSKIPDPAGWKLEVFKGKEENFACWRETFDLQAGLIWHNIDVVLEALRDKTVTVDANVFSATIHELGFDPNAPEVNAVNWQYTFISKKLYMVLQTYAFPEVRKVIQESVAKCGLDAYRLLNREYDPISADKGYDLLERILVIARWNVKGIDEEVASLREALKRV